MTMLPDQRGHFGDFGGRYVPETLMPALEELTKAYEEALADPEFTKELDYYLQHYVGRPNPLYYAERLSEKLGGAKIYLKREDLNHTGAHKINNTLGQVLLAKRMGKTRVIAETGAGQHGVATATACAMFGMECEVFMGEEDVRRQSLNVFRMKMLGTKVIAVTNGSKTLKDAINEAMRYWATNVRDTFYCFGTAAGPHPWPLMVREFQAVIGREARQQILEQEGRLPDYVLAAVGGGSNAIGIFHPFKEDQGVQLVGVEAAGHGIESGKHSVTIGAGSLGILHGAYSYVLQDENGMIQGTHSISAGLDYPGVGPEHGFLNQTGRAQYVSVTDQEALDAFQMLCRTEGIIPALESSHAVAHAIRLAPTLSKDQIIIVNLSGRGDKDVHTVAEALGMEV